MSEEEAINVLIPFQIIKTEDGYALVNENFTVEDVWDEGTPEYYDEAGDPQLLIDAWVGAEFGVRPSWYSELLDEKEKYPIPATNSTDDISVEEVATNERL